MAKGKSPETEVPALLSEGQVTPETALPEQVETTPETGAPGTPVQGKLDLKAQLETLSKEELETIHEEVWPGLRDSDRGWGKSEGKKSAIADLQADQQRQFQANQELQATLKNLDGEVDDNKRAGHILAFAQRQAWDQANRKSLADLESVRESFGVTPEEHTEIIFKLTQQAQRDGRIATFGDYVKAVTGERYVSKQEAGKLSRAEMDAYWEEKVGKQAANEPAPVSVGQGQPVIEADVANAKGQEAKRIAFEKRHGFKPL